MYSFIGKPLEMCKVCVLGADGRIGRHLSLKLKLNKLITHLSLYGLSDMSHIKEDLSHIDTEAIVSAYSGDEKSLIDALKCSNLVVIVAGQAHSAKYQSREALFESNAGMMLSFMKALTLSCPRKMPFVHVVTNPVNAMIPLCAEYLKDVGYFNPRKLVGSCSVDSMRARTFLGQLVNHDPAEIIVPVIGGHSAGSIIPLVSQRRPKFELSSEEEQKLAERIINGASEVIKAYKSRFSAFLSLSHCVAKFCDSICRAIHGEKGVAEVGYSAADVNECEFFSCNFSLNAEGISEYHRIPPMTSEELKLYSKSLKDIQINIKKAKEFYKKYKFETTSSAAQN